MEMNTDPNEIHHVEEELHVEILPGTEIMTDLNDHHFVKSKTIGGADKVLVPQPTADPHDPLNWSRFWKICCILNVSWVTFAQNYGPLSLAPMEESLIHAFDCTLADAIQFQTVAILVLGFSNFLWVPLTSTYGRRPTMILSQLINLGSAIWRAKATSYSSFLGASALNGLGAGPGETLQPAVIADLFFLHERGVWNTWYFTIFFGAIAVGPIIAGPMAAQVGWRSFWWLYAAVLASSVVMTIFLGPETRYHRPHPDEIAQHAPSTSKMDSELVEGRQTPSSEDRSSQGKQEQVSEPPLGKGGPSLAQFMPFQNNKDPWKELIHNLWTPWKLFAFPIVQFASFIVSWSASCFLTVNLTQSQVFAAPPYSFSETSIGLLNFAVLVGLMIGLATGGPLSDWIAMRATTKNGGVREPEMRLPAMIPYVLIMILGNVILAVGYQHVWPWPATVVIGYACAGIQVAVLPALASTYAVDSYKPVTGSVFVSITLWGYGFGKFLTPWIMEAGFVKPIMLNMCLTTLWCLTGFIFYYYGKTIRRWSKNSSVHNYTN